MSEAWKTINEFPNYAISDIGRVKSLVNSVFKKPGDIMSQFMSPFYCKVSLYKNKKHYTRSVHRIMAETFLGDAPTAKHQVGHIDGNPKNNDVSNLKWCTPKENQKDRIKHGTMFFDKSYYQQKITEDDARYIISSTETIRNLSEQFGLSQRHVQNIRSGKKWARLHSMKHTK